MKPSNKKNKWQGVPRVKNLNKQSTGNNQKIELKAVENESIDTRIKKLWLCEIKKKNIVLTEKELVAAIKLTKKKLKYLIHKTDKP